jgi:hypothetical protein
MANCPILSTHFSKHFLKTKFQLGFLGDPGVGKTHVLKWVMGDESQGIPTHGIAYRWRYMGGITVRKWIDIAQYYEHYPILFLVPEWETWFANRVMSNYLKLALEHKEIRYETMTSGTIRFKFGSYFASNYNVRSRGYNYDDLICDPDLRALEDRLLCRFRQMRKSTFCDILASMEEHILGRAYQRLEELEVTPQLLRAHVTLMYAINTRHLGANLFKPAAVRFTEKQVRFINGAAREAIEYVAVENQVRTRS